MTDDFSRQSSDFVDRLVSVDPLPTGRKSELQQELNDMFEQKLTLPRRIIFAAVTLLAFSSMSVCGYLAATEPDLPPSGRIGLGVGTLFGLSWVLVCIRILVRGTIDRKRDNRIMANMAWTFTVLMVVFFLYGGMSLEDRLLGLMLIGQALAFLIGAAVILITQRIEQSELATREKLLQIELLLAELREESLGEKS